MWILPVCWWHCHSQGFVGKEKTSNQSASGGRSSHWMVLLLKAGAQSQQVLCHVLFEGKSPLGRIILKGTPMNWADRCKYLGILFGGQLTDRFHVQKIDRTIKDLSSALGSLLRRNSVLCIDNKLFIYKTMFLPVILYGFAALAISKGMHITKPCIMQNKLLWSVGNFHSCTNTC